MVEKVGDVEGREAALRAPLRARAYYPILYMFLVTFFFTAVLVGLDRATGARVEANRQIMFERAVLLAVLPDEVGEGTAASQIHRIFTDEIASPDGTSGGAYRLVRSGELAAYAIPIEGKGFWDTIRGVIGVMPDRETVTGIAFYDQKETPGLGAEIVKPFFRDRFKGIHIGSGDRPIGLVQVGAETGENAVHAITGATQTSSRLEKIINDGIGEWRSTMGGAKGGES